MKVAGSSGNPGDDIQKCLNRFIADISIKAEALSTFWISVRNGGGSAIVRPQAGGKHPEALLAVTKDLSKENPTYPEYSNMGGVI